MQEVRGLQAWLKLLLQQKLPALDFVVQRINGLQQSAETDADDLAQIILHDASLTARVLRVANSVQYNRSGKPIQTVSRAIVQIGFLEIKNIALTSALVSGLLKDKPREMLQIWLSRSFHAAVQARAMVPKHDLVRREQVFVAALLRHIAELSLLSSEVAAVEEFIQQRETHPQQEHALAMKYLGVGIDTLSRELAKEWKLGDVIQDLFASHPSVGSCRSLVDIADGLSVQLVHGIDSPQVGELLEKMQQLTGLNREACRQQVLLMAEETRLIATQYEAEVLSSAVPAREVLVRQSPVRRGDELVVTFRQWGEAAERRELSAFFQQAMLVLHEGAEFSRCGWLTLDYQARRLQVSYLAGRGTDQWRQQISLPLEGLSRQEMLYQLLREPVVLRHQADQASTQLGCFQQMLPEGGDCMAAGIRIDKRLFGILYADLAGKPSTDMQWQTFQMIVQMFPVLLEQTLRDN